MVDKMQPNDESRRTFLKSIGVTGAATAGLGTLSESAAAKSTSTTTQNAMKKINLNADDIVPANKLLSISLVDFATERVESMDVLVDGTPINNVQAVGANTLVLSVFDLLTNLNLQSQDSVEVKCQGKTKKGTKFVGTDTLNVVDPTNILGGVTETVSDTVGGPTETVTGTVDSLGVLSETSSTKKQQMY